jgi:hypothetical protein
MICSNLSKNRLHSLADKIFDGLRGLDYMYREFCEVFFLIEVSSDLSENQLSSLPAQIFSDLYGLSYLYF